MEDIFGFGGVAKDVAGECVEGTDPAVVEFAEGGLIALAGAVQELGVEGVAVSVVSRGGGVDGRSSAHAAGVHSLTLAATGSGGFKAVERCEVEGEHFMY